MAISPYNYFPFHHFFDTFISQRHSNKRLTILAATPAKISAHPPSACREQRATTFNDQLLMLTLKGFCHRYETYVEDVAFP